MPREVRQFVKEREPEVVHAIVAKSESYHGVPCGSEKSRSVQAGTRQMRNDNECNSKREEKFPCSLGPVVLDAVARDALHHL